MNQLALGLDLLYQWTMPPLLLMLMGMGKLLLDLLLMSMELGEGKLEMEGLSGDLIYTDAGQDGSYAGG